MIKTRIVILGLLLAIFSSGMATDRKKLERKRKAKLAEIRATNKILRQTRSKKNITLKELKSINNLIQVREDIIQGLAAELDGVQQEVSTKEQQLNAVKMHLKEQKNKYANSLATTYRLKQSAGNKWHFIFSSNSFNQLLQRIRYLQKIADYQKNMVGLIEQDRVKIEGGIVVLKGLKVEKDSILGTKEEEREKLEGDKELQKKTIQVLSGKEQELRKRLRSQKAAKAKLDKEIERLIRIELEKARRKKAFNSNIAKGDKSFNAGDYKKAISYYEIAVKQKINTRLAKSKIEKAKVALAKKKSTGQKTQEKAVTETTTAQTVSNAQFLAQKGKLPWPTNNGFISEKFGKHPHPTISGVTVNNNGVNIMASSGTIAKAVYSGTVVAVMEIPGMQNMVMISHGDYFTVYAKLSSIFVKKGDNINANQSIGKVFTNENSETELHFELWYNQTKQNPAYWLKTK